jgi:hypothetical protein
VEVGGCWRALAPSTHLAARDVVEIQLLALQHDDVTHAGMSAAYQFCSTSQRITLGSLEDYVKLVASSHPVLLQSTAFTIRPLNRQSEATENCSAFLVRVQGKSTDDSVFFVWLLSLYSDCWLTDWFGVVHHPLLQFFFGDRE